MRQLLAVVFLAAVFAGCNCSKPPDVTDSGTPDAGCDGTIGCACKAGACTTGECVNNTCTSCSRGAANCTCRSNGTCDVGQQCGDAGICQTCPAGTQGCPCDTGDTCTGGLTCASGTCVPNTCVDGAHGCPCRTSGSKCDGTMYCDGTNTCQDCSTDVVGCPCASNACTGGLVCNTGDSTCRAAVDCGSLVDAGTCLPHQLCMQSSGQDAMCVSMMCETGYQWNGMTMSCDMCPNMNCAMQPDCTPDGGLANMCAGQHRLCTTSGMTSTCGNCLNGYTDQMGICVPAPTCGTMSCSQTQYCDSTTDPANPTCVALPCTAGQAKNTAGMCQSCGNLSCTGLPGLSGRIWPFTTGGGTDVCICETLDGWYMPAGGNTAAVLCDADHDGWVRSEAFQALGDRATAPNARCQFRRVDSVRLVDEYGDSMDVLSCNSGLVPVFTADAGTCGAGGVDLLPLQESLRNDTPGEPLPGVRADVYGDAGRLLQASELNSLTKGCVNLTTDYNDNRIDDIKETQFTALPSMLNPTTEQQRLQNFSYFMELATSWFEPTSGTGVGRLVIAERSRCAGDFPLRYSPTANPDAPNDTYSSTLAGGPTYWRNCSRGRDPGWSPAMVTVGEDFQQYVCDAGVTCPIAPPPHAQYVAPVDAGTVLLRNFGLCELNGTLPKDHAFRGLLHASQFKCVSVTSSTTNLQTFERNTSAFGAGTDQLTLNNCRARICDGGPCDYVAGPQGSSLPQTLVPKITCSGWNTGVPAGPVGFAAINYKPYGPPPPNGPSPTYTNTLYGGGCINEDTQYGSYVCPFPSFALTRAGDTSFGRYSCFGVGPGFLWCDSPCIPDMTRTMYWNASPAAPDGGPTNPTGSVLR